MPELSGIVISPGVPLGKRARYPLVAKILHRLGTFCYRRRKLTVAIWLLVLAAFVVGAFTLSGPSSTEFSIPGTEAQRAIDLLG
jgi:RND superfamily putative drug exporter